MAPRIRYCPTPAGRIAYSATGGGPPVLLDSGWVTHLQRQLDLPSFRCFVERLSEHFTVIRYDKPGCGLSDRIGADLSLEGQVTAALAVMDAAGAERLHLFGASQGGQLAAALAAAHPRRVDRMVLYGTCASGEDLAPEEVRSSLVALVRANWGLGSRLLTDIFFPEPSLEEIEAFPALQRACASATVAARLLDAYYSTDIRSLLPALRSPTLVLHREGDAAADFALGREVAALIPGATLVPLAGRNHLFYRGDWESVLDALVGFLGRPRTGAPRLTVRELEVARLVAEGLTNQAIANRLSMAPRTAESHVDNIRRKLDVHSRAQIAAWATEERLRSAGPL